MLPFTARERQAVLFLAFLFLTGLSFRLFFILKPAAQKHVAVLDDASYRLKTNINKATYDALLSIPHIGPSSAAKIIRYRHSQGPLKGPEDLAVALQRKPQDIHKILSFLAFQ